jgi:cell division protein FtsN
MIVGESQTSLESLRKEVMKVKKMIIIILAAVFTFALVLVSLAEEKKVETLKSSEKPSVKETVKPAQDMTNEEIKTDIPDEVINESDEDDEEEEEE